MRDPSKMSRDELEEEVRWLREELAVQLDATSLFKIRCSTGLCNQAARILLALYQSNGRMIGIPWMADNVIPCFREGDRDGDACVTVRICQVRKAVGYDSIGHLYGIGYHMTPLGIGKVSAMLADSWAKAA